MAKDRKPAARKTIRRADDKKPTNRRPDKRGTPKGKGTAAGGPGATTSGKKRKGRIGNPRYVVTAEDRIRVEAMVTAGAQQWYIAEQLGVSEDTLQRHPEVRARQARRLEDHDSHRGDGS
jgi:hypothetical protein